ncbi:GNAT family N-acetyltransferase [Pseudoxanthomonas koreensis]|uniref:GNAT family N-acetyltransferase n=1 Tax=Pseudoxanthomonas koreensis TaxID=266061 RepID=UPI001390EC26|nr:GNAT family N-acetyltransferase [Pseudoxanthomonas koreensis]KAF1691228.1 GNAT family N-acetyltransferase [Pseudoxanthomonas koreensis]
MTDLPAIAHDPAHPRFFLQLDGHEAELEYHLQDGVMVIDHTGVPAEIGGRGLAGHLVRHAFEHARGQGWRVLPACSYAEVWAARHPDYADLLVD